MFVVMAFVFQVIIMGAESLVSRECLHTYLLIGSSE